MWPLGVLFLYGVAAMPSPNGHLVLNITDGTAMNQPDTERALCGNNQWAPNEGKNEDDDQMQSRDVQTIVPQFIHESEQRDFHETNPLLTPYGRLEEGDLLRSPEEDRKAVTSGQRWDNRRYSYEITSGADKSAIEAGIQFWRDNSCVEFDEVSAGSSVPRVQFVAETGCWSMVGCVAKHQASRVQKLSIGDGCTSFGTVTHEIGHSLGFYHEQARSDRDNYVTIMWDNIQDSGKHNFNKVATTEHHEVPYDLSSVMHYGTRFFSSNGMPTIVTLDPTHQGLIGQRKQPSFRDVALMNRLYRCEELCSSPPACGNGGYVTKDCVCHCPPGTTGTSCQTITGEYYPEPACGGVVTTEGLLTSPGWPGLYPTSSDCFWWIKPPAGRKASVTFTSFYILQEVNNSCKHEYVNVKQGGVMDSGVQYCDKQLAGKQLTATSQTGEMVVHFHAYRKHYMGTGFVAQVQFV